MSILHMLNSTMTVKRATTTTAGRSSVSYAAHLSGVACRAHQLSEAERSQYGAPRGVKLWRFSVEPSNDIIRTDQITFTDRDGTVHIIDVKSVRDSSQGFGSVSVIKVIEGEEVT